MKILYKHCPICGNAEWTVPSSYVPEEVACKCSVCGLLCTDKSCLKDPNDMFNAENVFIKIQINDVYYQKTAFNIFMNQIKTARKHAHGNRMLDIGCSLGESVRAGLSLGLHVTAVEISDYAREYLSKRYNINTYKTLDDLQKEKHYYFDIIFTSHTIEHVENPCLFIKKTYSMLAKSGVIFAAVPNPYSLAAKFARENWAGWSPSGHYFHFSRKSITHLLNSIGFTIVFLGTSSRYRTYWTQAWYKNIKEKKTLVYRFLSSLPVAVRVRFLAYMEYFLNRVSNVLKIGDEIVVVAKKL